MPSRQATNKGQITTDKDRWKHARQTGYSDRQSGNNQRTDCNKQKQTENNKQTIPVLPLVQKQWETHRQKESLGTKSQQAMPNKPMDNTGNAGQTYRQHKQHPDRDAKQIREWQTTATP